MQALTAVQLWLSYFNNCLQLFCCFSSAVDAVWPQQLTHLIAAAAAAAAAAGI
jgi:hypothetical protein